MIILLNIKEKCSSVWLKKILNKSSVEINFSQLVSCSSVWNAIPTWFKYHSSFKSQMLLFHEILFPFSLPNNPHHRRAVYSAYSTTNAPYNIAIPFCGLFFQCTSYLHVSEMSKQSCIFHLCIPLLSPRTVYT